MSKTLALGLALAALACAAGPAHASIDAFGNVHGKDRKVLLHAFKAHHGSAYVVRGMHASVLFRFRYVGVYYLRRAGGANVDSGVAVFKRRGRRGWRPQSHLSRRLAANMQPDGWRYSAALSGGGEFKRSDITGADDPSTTTSNVTDIHLTLQGGAGPLEIVRGNEEPVPAAAPTLLGGSGTSQYTDAANSSNDYSCTVTLGPSDSQTSIDPLWPKSGFAVDLDLGRPVESSSVPDCGANVEDPGNDLGLEFTIPGTPLLGKPFAVPISIHHSNSYESLSLDGTISFKLLDVMVPTLN